MAIEKISCLLCRGTIAFKGRNQTRYLDHMKEEHNVRYDFDVLLVTSLMDQAEKDSFVHENRNRFEPVKENSNIKRTSAELTKKSKKREETLQELVSNENTKTTVISSDEELEPRKVDNETSDVDDVKSVKKPIIEGVLKCKSCDKYIKQSAMAEHKLSHGADKHIDDETENNSANVLELEENVVKALTMVEKTNEVITSNKANKVTTAIKRKSKIDKDDEAWEGGSDGDSDEDWDVKKTKIDKKKKVKCKICGKKFANSMGMETHTRVVHRAKEPSAADMEKAITNALSKNSF